METDKKNKKTVTNNHPLLHTKKSKLDLEPHKNADGCPKDCLGLEEYPNCICSMYKN